MDDTSVYFMIYFLLSLIPATFVTMWMLPELGERPLERLTNALLMLVLVGCLWPMVMVGFIPYHLWMRSLEKKHGRAFVERLMEDR